MYPLFLFPRIQRIPRFDSSLAPSRRFKPRNTLNTRKGKTITYFASWQFLVVFLFSAYEDKPYLRIGIVPNSRRMLEVYRDKGCGFLEPVYQECMEIELRLRGISYFPQKQLALEYKGCPLRSKYEPDFICYGKIILELKAVTELADDHRAQVQNYLKATGFKLGLLVNFGHYQRCKSNESLRNGEDIITTITQAAK
jgi:GxxExxY protein